MSVTENAFLGSMRNRSRGDRLSGRSDSAGAVSSALDTGAGSLICALTRRFSVSQIYYDGTDT
jgi:hypothetical protein